MYTCAKAQTRMSVYDIDQNLKTYIPRRLPAPQFQIVSPVPSMSMKPFWRPATASSSAMDCTLKFGGDLIKLQKVMPKPA
jgi:hypothetical protein